MIKRGNYRSNLKATTEIGNGRLAKRLVIGSANYVGKQRGLLRPGTGIGYRWLEQFDRVNGQG
jgi:hypothetical protein